MKEKDKKTRNIWLILIVIAVLMIIYFTFKQDDSFIEVLREDGILLLWVAGMAFFAEYFDSSLGMGFGIIMFPVLLIAGYAPKTILPALLAAEFVNGFISGFAHYRVGNVDFKKESPAWRALWILIPAGLLAILPGVLLMKEISRDGSVILMSAVYIALGLLVLIGKSILGKYNPHKLRLLGLTAGFMKGITGGGFGPVITGGQVVLKIPVKSAVAVTSIVEAAASLLGLGLSVALLGMPDLKLCLVLTGGSLLAVPLAAWTVQDLPKETLKTTIGFAMLFLGIMSLIRMQIGF